MPVSAPRPCTNPMCFKMAVKKGRCDEHQPKAWASSEGKTASQRGYGAKWKKQRKIALMRDQYLCQPCKEKGIFTKANEVDHIINKAKGGNDDIINLQSICTDCHKQKTRQEKKHG